MFLSFEDWEQFYSVSAENNGWRLTDVGPIGAEDIIVESSRSDVDDQEAVSALYKNFILGDICAVAAYNLLRRCNRREFSFWNMEKW
jgi:hypothetical protein